MSQQPQRKFKRKIWGQKPKSKSKSPPKKDLSPVYNPDSPSYWKARIPFPVSRSPNRKDYSPGKFKTRSKSPVKPVQNIQKNKSGKKSKSKSGKKYKSKSKSKSGKQSISRASKHKHPFPRSQSPNRYTDMAQELRKRLGDLTPLPRPKVPSRKPAYVRPVKPPVPANKPKLKKKSKSRSRSRSRSRSPSFVPGFCKGSKQRCKKCEARSRCKYVGKPGHLKK